MTKGGKELKTDTVERKDEREKDEKDIKIISKDYKPIDPNDFSADIKELYERSSEDVREIVENIFNETVLEYSKPDRPLPKYADGTLDAPFLEGGRPAHEKPLALYNTILSGNVSTIEVEGGVRGAKDIYALLGWSRYLMVCPDRMHLAIGTSLEHILKTVLMSDGFGLFFTIPHGIFVRESISGAQRGAYKFVDNYGIEKQILFYGNDKENDSDKYQGFTLGSVYVNETLNQHIRGLVQAENRMASVKQPLMIMTQNPKGKAHSFYQRFERAKLGSIRDVEALEFVRDVYGDAFRDLENRIKADRDKAKKNTRKTFFANKGVPDYKYLSIREQIELNEKLLDLNFKFDKKVRGYTAQDFDKTLKEGDYLWNKGMKKIVHYFRGSENPNNIKNFYDFGYFHFTIDDNVAMSEMQRSDFRNKRAVGTSVYDQEVLGIRRSTDSAVYSMFSSKNVFGGDIQSFDYTGLQRVIAIDKGLNHPNGIIDVEIDFEEGRVWQLQESLLDFKQKDVENLGLESIYLELLGIIRSRRDRQMPMTILVDPSAIELIKYLKHRDLPVREANNAVWSIRGEKDESHKLQDKDLIGIPFVQTAIAKLKYMVHESCVFTIEQIGSYEAPFDEKAGKEKVKKVNDDLVDPVRYVFNTLIRLGMWQGGSEDVKNDTGRVSGNDSKEKSQWDLGREVVRAFYGEEYGQIIDENDITGFNNGSQSEASGTGFWDNSGGFFGL